MTGAPLPPHDLRAEARIIASCLVTPDRLTGAVAEITDRDFYRPQHAVMWRAVVDAWQTGSELSMPVVGAALRDAGYPPDLVVETVAENPTGPIGESCRIVADLAIRRRLLQAIGEVTPGLYAAEPVDDAIASLQRAMTDAHDGAQGMPAQAIGADEMIDRDGEHAIADSPWVIAGQLRQSDRVIIVAAEGVGKMVLLRQLAACVAQGVHPFAPGNPTPQVPTLIIDGENPDGAIRETLVQVGRELRLIRGHDYLPDACWVYRKPGGLNLRSRVERAELEKVLRWHRPRLVCAGPLYKLWQTRPGETDEQSAQEAQQVLDDLRGRYSFALVLEAHAPKGVGKARDMVPQGSSLWLRWPEFGLTLIPAAAGGAERVTVGRFRKDRLRVAWPDELMWGRAMPWEARWNDSMFHRGVARWDRDDAPF